ncbi:MAG: flagellar hook assembly protein FlgD [Candidatus Methylomirabilales bacterium]
MVAGIIASLAGSVLSGIMSKAFASGAAEAPAQPQTLDKEDFLKLLTVQLRNQDPLNPMQNTEFMAQTAQFSSLEQLQNMNRSLERLLAQSGGGLTGGAALLGRTVTVNAGSLSLGTQGGAAITYSLPAGAAGVAIQIQDPAGTPVRTLLLGAQGAGSHQVPFDGLDEAGRRLPAGAYRYRVRAVNAAGQVLPGVVTGGGTVTGLNVEDGRLILLLGDERVALSDVVAVVSEAQ